MRYNPNKSLEETIEKARKMIGTLNPRSPQRIKKILKLLKIYWETYPDLRLCQIISNMVSEPDIFYVEDDIIAERIAKGILDSKKTKNIERETIKTLKAIDKAHKKTRKSNIYFGKKR